MIKNKKGLASKKPSASKGAQKFQKGGSGLTKLKPKKLDTNKPNPFNIQKNDPFPDNEKVDVEYMGDNSRFLQYDVDGNRTGGFVEIPTEEGRGFNIDDLIKRGYEVQYKDPVREKSFEDVELQNGVTRKYEVYSDNKAPTELGKKVLTKYQNHYDRGLKDGLPNYSKYTTLNTIPYDFKKNLHRKSARRGWDETLAEARKEGGTLKARKMQQGGTDDYGYKSYKSKIMPQAAVDYMNTHEVVHKLSDRDAADIQRHWTAPSKAAGYGNAIMQGELDNLHRRYPGVTLDKYGKVLNVSSQYVPRRLAKSADDQFSDHAKGGVVWEREYKKRLENAVRPKFPEYNISNSGIVTKKPTLIRKGDDTPDYLTHEDAMEDASRVSNNLLADQRIIDKYLDVPDIIEPDLPGKFSTSLVRKDKPTLKSDVNKSTVNPTAYVQTQSQQYTDPEKGKKLFSNIVNSAGDAIGNAGEFAKNSNLGAAIVPGLQSLNYLKQRRSVKDQLDELEKTQAQRIKAATTNVAPERDIPEAVLRQREADIAKIKPGYTGADARLRAVSSKMSEDAKAAERNRLGADRSTQLLKERTRVDGETRANELAAIDAFNKNESLSKETEAYKRAARVSAQQELSQLDNEATQTGVNELRSRSKFKAAAEEKAKANELVIARQNISRIENDLARVRDLQVTDPTLYSSVEEERLNKALQEESAKADAIIRDGGAGRVSQVESNLFSRLKPNRRAAGSANSVVETGTGNTASDDVVVDNSTGVNQTLQEHKVSADANAAYNNVMNSAQQGMDNNTSYSPITLPTQYSKLQTLYNTFNDLGIASPQAKAAVLSQFGLESGWGTNTGSKHFNYGNVIAGSKWDGKTVEYGDTDAAGNPITQVFRSYDSPKHAAQDWINVIQKGYPDAYKQLTGNAFDMDQYMKGLSNGWGKSYRYAEDPNYENKVSNIYKYVSQNIIPASKNGGKITLKKRKL